MQILNPDTVIEDSLAQAFVLPTYLKIMAEAGREDFRATDGFRTMYNGYYRVRQKPKEWYDRYFALMESQRTAQLSFEDLLRKLYDVKPSVEVSFASKLIATVDPGCPIWDQYVLKNLGLWEPWQAGTSFPFERRVELAGMIYRTIQEWYRQYLASPEGVDCVARFDSALPHYRDKVSAVKKIDFFLWTKRSQEDG